MSAETAAVLRKARALIDTPNRWVQGVEALDAHRAPVAAYSSAAVCFCVAGAVINAGRAMKRIRPARLALEAQLFQRIEDWNDNWNRTHAEVMAAFDAAIAAEEATA